MLIGELLDAIKNFDPEEDLIVHIKSGSYYYNIEEVDLYLDDRGLVLFEGSQSIIYHD